MFAVFILLTVFTNTPSKMWRKWSVWKTVEPDHRKVTVHTWMSWACAGFVTAGCWIKIVCVQVERSERSERSVLTAWGPGARLRAPGGVQGQRPGGGPGGRAPGSSWVFRVFKTPKRLSSHSFSFIFKTSFSAKSFDIVRYIKDDIIA